MTIERPLYRPAELRALIRPRSLAVVGASSGGAGFGTAALRELSAAEFTGPLYAVNPRLEPGDTLLAARCVRSLDDLPGPLDCVLVAVPAPQVVPVIEQAAALGCGAAIIFSAGFSEAAGGNHGAERALGEIAVASGMRIGGPNTAGVLNYRDRLPLTFVSDLRMDLPAGNLAIVSQSAGIATHLGHVRHRGAGISYTITTGNSVDVTALDYVNFLLDDDATDVVALALEGVDHARALTEIGDRARAVGKPILVLKAGRTGHGSRAAASHTGSLTGSHDVFLTAADEASLVVCASTEDLIESALLFAKWAGKPHRPGGAAILTTMGGPGVLAADAAEDHGVDLPPPSPTTSRRLGELIPSFAAVGNPVDTTAFQSDEVLGRSLGVLADDEAYSAVVMLTATTTGPATAGRPAAIAAAALETKTPVCAVWLSSWLEGPGSELLDASPDVPVFRSSERCFGGIARWQQWHARQADPDESGPSDVPAVDPSVAAAIDDVLAGAGVSDGRVSLDEVRSARLLRAVGIRFPASVVAASAEDAAAAGESLGFPVVAKVVSAAVAHKARAGGVALGLGDREAVRRAFDSIVASVQHHEPDAAIDGVMVAETVTGGPEFMCGLVRDALFGPVVVCGAGGGAVEELGDVARCLAPMSDARARRAVRSLRAFRRLVASDPDSAGRLEDELAAAMVALGRLGTAEPRVAEVDLNPVVLGEAGLVALDALVVCSGRR